MRIYIIGLGGIGSWLIEPLMRFVKYMNIDCDFHLIDGDSFSNSNLVRQSVHPKLVGMNKASATALRMRQYFPDFDIKEYPVFLNEDNIAEIIQTRDSKTYVFNCCDNNYCRKIVSQHCVAMRGYITLLSGGNEVTDGNSHVHIEGVTSDLLTSHPEVAQASKDEDRGRMSCQQLADMPSSNQIVITNFWCAAIMLQQFYLLVKAKKTNIQETFFDINTSAINAITTRHRS